MYSTTESPRTLPNDRADIAEPRLAKLRLIQKLRLLYGTDIWNKYFAILGILFTKIFSHLQLPCRMWWYATPVFLSSISCNHYCASVISYNNEDQIRQLVSIEETLKNHRTVYCFHHFAQNWENLPELLVLIRVTQKVGITRCIQSVWKRTQSSLFLSVWIQPPKYDTQSGNNKATIKGILTEASLGGFGCEGKWREAQEKISERIHLCTLVWHQIPKLTTSPTIKRCWPSPHTL